MRRQALVAFLLAGPAWVLAGCGAPEATLDIPQAGSPSASVQLGVPSTASPTAPPTGASTDAAAIASQVQQARQPPVVTDPASGAEVQRAWEESQATMFDGTMEIAGQPYQAYAADVTGIGPDKPLRVAIIPPPGASPRDLDTPVLRDPSGQKIDVECSRASIAADPVVVTCRPGKPLAAGSVFQLGILEDSRHAAAVVIRVNVASGSELAP